MNVLVSGASGLVGSALVPSLEAAGHRVVRLVRFHPRHPDREVFWDPMGGSLDAEALARARPEAVVHLAGESIAEERWTPEKKARIRDSRVKGTALLARHLAELPERLAVLASASAVGYYGDRGDEVLTEESPPGTGFLAEVAQAWEAAAEPARAAGIRTVPMRFGIILSARGGALARMLPIFRKGLGGPLGSGRQWVSWIALDDVVGAIHHILATPALDGPVNVTAPQPVTSAEFARTLGRVLGKPAVFPAPAFALRLLFGEMADEALLASQRVEPARLKASGYAFRFPELEGALRHLLAEPSG